MSDSFSIHCVVLYYHWYFIIFRNRETLPQNILKLPQRLQTPPKMCFKLIYSLTCLAGQIRKKGFVYSIIQLEVMVLIAAQDTTCSQNVRKWSRLKLLGMKLDSQWHQIHPRLFGWLMGEEIKSYSSVFSLLFFRKHWIIWKLKEINTPCHCLV